MKLAGGPYAYGPCPHICGCMLGGTAPNGGDALLVCPVVAHPPFPPGCELQMGFSGQIVFLSGLSSFCRGLSFLLLLVAVAFTVASTKAMDVTIVIIFIASDRVDVKVDVQLRLRT